MNIITLEIEPVDNQLEFAFSQKGIWLAFYWDGSFASTFCFFSTYMAFETPDDILHVTHKDEVEE